MKHDIFSHSAYLSTHLSAQCWEESDRLFIQIKGTDCVMSHEEVSWPLTLRQEIPNIHIFNWAD
jgi:hypothetical protein